MPASGKDWWTSMAELEGARVKMQPECRGPKKPRWGRKAEHWILRRSSLGFWWVGRYSSGRGHCGANALGDLGPPWCCAGGQGGGVFQNVLGLVCCICLELCGRSRLWESPPRAGGFRSSGLGLADSCCMCSWDTTYSGLYLLNKWTSR